MAGNSDFTPGVGWTANSRPDFRWEGQPQVFIPTFVGKPQDEVGRNGDFSVDIVGRKIYEKSAGSWNAGTSF